MSAVSIWPGLGSCLCYRSAVPFLKSLPEKASLYDVFQAHPNTSRPLLEYHEVLLRGDSPLTVAQRELIAAYVSGLNACRYCHGIHSRVAGAFGVDAAMLEQLIDDVDASGVAEELKPLLRLARKLTLTPSRMSRADAEAVFAVGWNDRALHDAVSICALFNFMNRLVDGLGIDVDEEYFDLSAKRLHEGGYGLLADSLGGGTKGGGTEAGETAGGETEGSGA